MKGPRLILASSSPRRRQLLTEAGYEFTVIAPREDVECGICSESGPSGLVSELAYRKAASVRRELVLTRGRNDDNSFDANSTIIVAADTVAECDGFVLGKPRDDVEARAMLRQLRGRSHRVLTGLCVWRVSKSEPLVRIAVTNLVMDHLSGPDIEHYIASGHWEGKAGAFGYQDQLGWVRIESGSESNVVGLPLEMLAEMLSDVLRT
jgi:septum formation protein